MADTVVQELVINTLTQAQFDAAKEAGTLSPYELYGTPDTSAETLNAKADRNLLNTTDNVDIVVESQLPTADNGYTWYRKYKSGWVEQGGETTTSRVVTLPVEMSDTHYTVTQGIKYTASATWTIGSVRPVSTTTISVNKANGDASWWLVSGMSAQ